MGEAAVKIGSANLVVAIDAKRRIDDWGRAGSERARGERGIAAGASLAPARMPEGEWPKWEVCTHGGDAPTGIDAVAWAVRMAEAGAGEILLTSMDRDGTKGGYDLEMLRAVCDAVPIPVIASGAAAVRRTWRRRSATVPRADTARRRWPPRSSTSRRPRFRR